MVTNWDDGIIVLWKLRGGSGIILIQFQITPCTSVYLLIRLKKIIVFISYFFWLLNENAYQTLSTMFDTKNASDD